MKLASILAIVHAAAAFCLGWFTLPTPFHGLRWLRVVDFLVVWDMQSVGVAVLKVLGVAGHATSLAEVSSYATATYFASVVLAGSLQWFVVGLLFARIRARFHR